MIQKGTERKYIRISKLFVNGKIHGHVVDNSFVESDKSVDPVDLVPLVSPGTLNADSPATVVLSLPGLGVLGSLYDMRRRFKFALLTHVV